MRIVFFAGNAVTGPVETSETLVKISVLISLELSCGIAVTFNLVCDPEIDEIYKSLIVTFPVE